MSTGFLNIKGRNFYLNDEPIILRGYGLGTWLNLEHFMLGIPGTDAQIRASIITNYGESNAAEFWKHYYKAMVDEADFQFLKSLGINTIRIPFNYRIFEDDQNPYMYKQQGFVEIDRILELCKKYELFAVLDLHAAAGGQNPDWHSDNALGESLFWEYADFRRRAIALWKHIARRYASNRWIAGYDLLNEPVVLHRDKQILNRFFSELIREIRTVDKNHVLFVEGDMYSSRFELFAPFEDPNVACSFHYYPFLHQHESSKKTQKDRIIDTLFAIVTLQDIFERLKRPVWCGETGALFNAGKRAQQESMLNDMLDIFEDHGISWSIWTYKDARSMGTLHPKVHSAWMKFSKSARREWNFWEEFNWRYGYVENLVDNFKIDVSDLEKLKIGLRVLANNQLILKEGYTELLKAIPFESFLRYVDSFNFDHCEVWDRLVDIVVKHTSLDYSPA